MRRLSTTDRRQHPHLDSRRRATSEHPDDVLQNGLDDPLGCAYEQICEEQRSVITRDEFVRTVGAAVSEMLTADSFAGPSVYTDRGLDAEHEGQATLDPDLESTWVDVLVTRYERVDERTVVSGSGKDERWRVELVREEGDWRLCGFAPIGR